MVSQWIKIIVRNIKFADIIIGLVMEFTVGKIIGNGIRLAQCSPAQDFFEVDVWLTDGNTLGCNIGLSVGDILNAYGRIVGKTFGGKV